MVDNWLNLDNKNVIITGASSGIGEVIAKSYLEQGANVINFDVKVPEYEVEFIECDLTNLSAISKAVDTAVDKFKRIDVLVNNAGVNLPRLLFDKKAPESDYQINEYVFDLMFDINVKSVVFLSSKVTENMEAHGSGVIVNVSSESGKEGSQGQSIYSATKGAINGLTRSWGKELGQLGIRVAGIAPGIIEETGLRTQAYNEALAYSRGIDVDQLNTDYSSSIPLGRVGKLKEVADLVMYLSSDKASYITGTTFNISGGKSR